MASVKVVTRTPTTPSEPRLGAAAPVAYRKSKGRFGRIVIAERTFCMTAPKLVFVVTEDWFFASHFLPMLGAAARAGYEPVVLTRVRNHRTAIERVGGRVVALQADRGRQDPLTLLRTTRRIAAALRQERPELVHCIALRSILLGGTAAILARVPRRVFAVTGGGYLTARSDPLGRLASQSIRLLVGRALPDRHTRFLFENRDDPVKFGLDPDGGRVHIVGGAGVDPDDWPVVARPGGGPLRVALVSRMLWSKGVDVAVEAVRQARAEGAEIELSLYGAPDTANPKAVRRETLLAWNALEGITWHGRTDDVRAVWAAHDVACLPSRGGEGLPRTLLEAAASGRAIVTTNVPGCRDLVRDGLEGLIVPPGDVEALRDALIRLSADRTKLAAMQSNARRRVLDGFTEAAVAAEVERMYRAAAR